jgi:hypothetical protein
MTNQELLAVLKKNPVSVGCGVLTVLLGVGIYFRSDRLPEVTAELEQKSAEGQRLAANLQNSAQLTEQYAAIAQAGKEIESRLIKASELAKNLGYFYKLEADTATKLIELRPLPLAPVKGAKSTYVPVIYSVAVQGDYTQLLEFLRRLEHGAHYCRIVVSAISGTSNERGPLRLSLTVELLGQP